MLPSGEKLLPHLPRPSVVADRGWKPNTELAPNCPRCNSSNTKFCYYNNYSLSQPRYFCKGCRRYWTKGGSLRNVPVGGGCRKNRRSNSAMRTLIDRPAIPPKDSNYGCDSIRPDLMLDDPLGNSRRSVEASTSDGSNIDLALLYAKFLNQCPEFDPTGHTDLLPEPELQVDDDPFDLVAGILMSSSDYQMPPVQEHGAADCQMPSSSDVIPQARSSDEFPAASTGELNICFDPSSSVSQQVLPNDDIIWPNCMGVPDLTWQSPQSQEFGPVLEDQISPHHPTLLNEIWSTFDLSSYDV